MSRPPLTRRRVVGVIRGVIRLAYAAVGVGIYIGAVPFVIAAPVLAVGITMSVADFGLYLKRRRHREPPAEPQQP